MDAVILELARAVTEKRNVALATIIEARGGTPAVIGAKILCTPDGQTVGTVGGGKLEAAIISDCKIALREKKPIEKHYSLTKQGADALGMICGGEVRAFIDVMIRAPQLIIIGGGHVGGALQKLAEVTGFDVAVVDPKKDRTSGQPLGEILFSEDTYAVIMTSDYVSDEEALRYLIDKDIAYVGMIASKTKSAIILKNLRDSGFKKEQIDKVHTPIGLDLGGRTPQEVALAILSEIVAVRNQGKILEIIS